MSLIHEDRLQELFPHWRLERREIIWLFFNLQSRGAIFNFDLPGLREGMANYITNFNLTAEINIQKSYLLLPEQAFSWVEKNGRQPAWLLREVQRRFNGILVDPASLTPKERLIALFDNWNIEKSSKLSAVDQLKGAWVQQQLQDRKLSWYASAGKEKQKSQLAWQWYQKQHQFVAMYATKFSGFQDILEFLDSTNFSQEEKLHHLEQIKKRFKAQQTQANRRGKVQTNLSLSDIARSQLEELARRERKTKTEVIELLIQSAHENGLLQ